MILILLADGFEEIEALTPLDVLKRAGLDVKTVAITNKIAIGSHGIAVVCDLTADEINTDEVSTVIFPGGMPGSLNLDASPFTDKILSAVQNHGGRIAAICAAPLVLGRRGLLKGKEAICYPGFEKELIGAKISRSNVITDGNITTAKGMGAALDFALELVRVICGEEKSAEIADAILPETDFSSLDLPEIEETSSEFNSETDVGNSQFNAEINENNLNCLPPEIKAEAEEGKKKIIHLFEQLDIELLFGDIAISPSIIKYEVLPKDSSKTEALLELNDDLIIYFGNGARIEAPCPDSIFAKIELPRKNREALYLNELIESDEFKKAESKTTVCLGKSTAGEYVFSDIAKMPHLLIGGTTATGKSALIKSMMLSTLYKATPDEVKYIVIDSTTVEYPEFENYPHLLVPKIEDINKACGALMWAVDEMNRRNALFESVGAKDIDEYNEIKKDDAIPKIVIVIDELRELMLMRKKVTEALISYLSQNSKSAGIHLIISTQSAEPPVITSKIKASIASRLCFKTSAYSDSRTILDKEGAESLIFRYDCYFINKNSNKTKRIHSAFMPECEIEEFISKKADALPDFNYDVQAEINTNAQKIINKYNEDY